MSWIAAVLLVLVVLVAVKVAGAMLKLLLWLVVAAGLWWLVHPWLGLPLLPL